MTQTKEKHTELPWKVSDEFYVESCKDCGLVTDTSKPYPITYATAIANAQFIVKACNAHYELVGACKYAASYGTDEGVPSAETWAEMVYKCKQAIKNAG